MSNFHLHMGDLYFDAFKIDEAIAEYRAASRQVPRDLQVFMAMGFACYMSGYIGRERRYEDAVSAFEQALEISPSNAEALYGVGISYEGLGNTDVAFDVYFKLRALDEFWANSLLDDLLKNYK